MKYAYELIGISGLPGLARILLTKKGRFALNFHGIARRRYEHLPYDCQPHHTLNEFWNTLQWLSRRFNFLSVQDFLYTDRPGVLLTFDDGHANNLNVLPVLDEFGAQGLFFITAQHVRQPRRWLSFTHAQARRAFKDTAHIPADIAADCYDGLSTEQLAELARSPWAVIGGHTESHPSLLACSQDEFQKELKQSADYLREISNQPVNLFAYPFGEYDRRVAEVVAEAGYQAAFAVESRRVGLPAFEIPRVDLYSARPGYLSIKLSGLRWQPLRGPVLAGGA